MPVEPGRRVDGRVVQDRRDPAQHVHRGQHDRAATPARRSATSRGTRPAARGTPRRRAPSRARRARRCPSSCTIVESPARPRASPPMRRNSPSPVRTSTMPASRNSSTEMRPWLTIWNVAPVAPMSFMTKIPRPIMLIWAIDEYAMTPRESGCRKAISELHSRPMTASHTNQRRRSCAGLGEERQREAQHPVGAGLRDHAGEQRRDLRRRLAVGVREPSRGTGRAAP